MAQERDQCAHPKSPSDPSRPPPLSKQQLFKATIIIETELFETSYTNTGCVSYPRMEIEE
jgi:hypothetical protein